MELPRTGIKHSIWKYMHMSPRSVFEVLVVAGVFFFAEPTYLSLAVGGAFSFVGEVFRVWTIGYQRRANKFFVLGPYRFVRHPYYLGTFLVYLGLCIVSLNGYVLSVYLVGVVLLYGSFMKKEEAALRRLGGAKYQKYRNQVSSFIPQLIPVSPQGKGEIHYSLRRGLFKGRRREVEGIFILLACFGLLFLCAAVPVGPWLHWGLGGALVLFLLVRVLYYLILRRNEFGAIKQ